MNEKCNCNNEIKPIEINWNYLQRLSFDDSVTDYFMLCSMKNIINEIICIINTLRGNMLGIIKNIVMDLIKNGDISITSEYQPSTKTLTILLTQKKGKNYGRKRNTTRN